MKRTHWETTIGDFHHFVKCVNRHMVALNLQNWIYKFTHLDSEEDEELASVKALAKTRVAEFNLSVTWCVQPTKRHIDEVAFHEVLHVLMAPLMDLAENRYATKDALDDAEHDVIRGMCFKGFQAGFEVD